MSNEITSEFQPEPTLWRRVLRDGENLLVTIALLAMVALLTYDSALRIVPSVLEKCHAYDAARCLRNLLNHLRLSGTGPMVQHLTLVVGMLGGAIAARDNRLLALSTVTKFLRGRWKTVATVSSGAIAAAVASFLCAAFVLFIRDAGADETQVLMFGIRIRWVQWLMPVGFGLVAMRLLQHSASTWRGRLVAVGLFLVLVGFCFWAPISPEKIKWFAVAVLILATVLGAPLFTVLGGLALIFFWAEDVPMAAISTTHYSLNTNPSLPSIPLFTLAGYFLAEGGASRRMVRVFDAVFGQIRGGPAIVTALVCAFFTSFTGASGVTILALGGLLMPVLLAAKYSERNALGLLTGAGSLGLLFPPCLPLILYAIISTQAKASVSIEQMFLGGILPGLLMVGLTAWWGIAVGPKYEGERRRFNGAEARASLWAAKWELLLPVVAMVALFGGFATTVEASAIVALYAFIVETFVYGDLKWRSRRRADDVSAPDTGRVPKTILSVVTECGLLVGGVLLILGVANGFTNYLVDAQIPARLVEWTTQSIHTPWIFLLLLNLFLLVVGSLMDVYSAIIVVVPLIVPIGKAYNIDPVHLGIIFLANLELGYLTPPVGMNLFLSSYRFRKPMTEVTRAVIPMLLVLLVGVILITFIPPLTTLLPRIFNR